MKLSQGKALTKLRTDEQKHYMRRRLIINNAAAQERSDYMSKFNFPCLIDIYNTYPDIQPSHDHTLEQLQQSLQ